MKKLTAALLVLCMAFSFCACGLLGDNEREIVGRHYDGNTQPDRKIIYKPSDYESLVKSLYTMFSGGIESCTLRFFGYKGDVENDYKKACDEVLRTAIGKYAVYELTGKVEKVVTYYEANVSVAYKISTAKMSEMFFISDRDDMKNAAEKLLRDGKDSASVFIEPGAAEYADIGAFIAAAHMKYPTYTVLPPSVSVSDIYDGDDTEGSIISVKLSYPETDEDRAEKLVLLNETLNAAESSVTGRSDSEKLKNAAETLVSELSYVRQSESRSVDDTPYGALVEKRASSKGIALGFKALCDKLGIYCIAVSGKQGAEAHFWNIVAIDGEYYHIDASMMILDENAEKLFFSDAEMESAFEWDRDQYPKCESEYPA